MNKRTKEYMVDQSAVKTGDEYSRYAQQKVCLSLATGEHFFGAWFPPDFEPRPGDTLYSVPPGRLFNWSLISYKFFSTTKWDWAVHEFNKFLPGVPQYMMEPLKEGSVIVIPDRKTLQEILMKTVI